MIRALLILSALAALPGVAAAQSTDGGASLTIQRGLSVTASNLADAPAVIRIAGDPGRIYRIRLPEGEDQGVALIENLKILSVNAGDISRTRAGRLDADGRDLLRVSGQFRMRAGADAEPIAALPLSIDYE
ncbi:MAG: hypothetical protein EON88_21715 [Brevundimonas sp.]|nr:MAG: hypothetical protein EON88_21715 [Brevundimonas sp.]